jgi:predicted nucleic-acid-binding Zn-ribbon protein
VPRLKCPKCGSEDFDEKMAHIYGMWGEFLYTKQVETCKKCGTEIEERKDEDSTPKE